MLQISAGSISAACAIGSAYEKIADGTLDVAVAGGAECPLEPSIIERFISAGIIQAAARESTCRPFDRGRKGTVLGEPEYSSSSPPNMPCGEARFLGRL